MVSTFPRLVDESRDVETLEVEDPEVADDVVDEVVDEVSRTSEDRTQIPSLHFSAILQRIVLDFARFPEQKYSRTRISPSQAS